MTLNADPPVWKRPISYLLRLWRTEQNGALVWRASLENAHTGERWAFASMAELYAFLDQETAAVNEQEPPGAATDCRC
jgi:hypothetical protein